MQIEKAILANAFYSKNFDEISFVEKGIFLIDEEGLIAKVYEKEDKDYGSIRNDYLKAGKLKD